MLYKYGGDVIYRRGDWSTFLAIRYWCIFNSLHNLCVLGVSAVLYQAQFHRRDSENA
jgi:hypothetical protein